MERFALGILATGCSVVVPGPGDLTPTQGSDAGTDAQTHDMDAGRDAGADAGHDGGADSGHHGGRDAGFDAAADATVDLDAGSCGMCEGTTPFCDSTGACVECLENSHCDDGLHCTVDRCSFGTCTSTLRISASRKLWRATPGPAPVTPREQSIAGARIAPALSEMERQTTGMSRSKLGTSPMPLSLPSGPFIHVHAARTAASCAGAPIITGSSETAR